MSGRLPTENQQSALAVLANPGTLLVSGISGSARTWRSLLRRGWIEAKDPVSSPENGLRITPDGLRALADGLEAHRSQGS